MDPLGGQPLAQPAVWYNYSSFNDVLVNSSLQVQMAVPAVQMIAARSPTPPPTPTTAPTPTPSVAISMISVKPKKVKKLSRDVQVRNYICEECGAIFTNSSNLRSHMRIHSGVRPFVCLECGKSFIQSSNLKAHKRVHTGERPYQCSECGQKFSRSSHLVGHKRTHTGERPYICGLCGEAFYTSSHLRNHVRRHTGEKPYVCQHCGEAFGQSLELRVHVRHHTGEKPFKCRECDRSYVSARELRAHRKVTHFGSKPFKCDMCERCFRTQTFLVKHAQRCTGPRPKRPKGRPPKYPRAEGEEPPWKKPKKPKNRKPAAPTDRISRSKTRAMRIAKLKVEVETEEETIGSEEVIDSDEGRVGSEGSIDSSKVKVNSSKGQIFSKVGKAGSLGGGQVVKEKYLVEEPPDNSSSPSPLLSESSLKHELSEDMSQLPVVQVMLDNLGNGAEGFVLHQVPSSSLQALQALSTQREQLGVMDLSGQQMHEGDHQEVDDVQPSIGMLPGQQRISIVAADQQLPVISSQHQASLDHHQIATVVESQHCLDNHQKLPVNSTHQQSVGASQFSVVNSLSSPGGATTLPTVAAHQQTTVGNQLVSPNLQNAVTHQQLTAMPAHQHLSTVGTPHQLPVVAAHQNTSSLHQQLPLQSAHQNLLAVSVNPPSSAVAAHRANTVTAHQNASVVNAHQQMSTAVGHQILPVVSAHQQLSTATAQHVSTSAHQQLSGATHHHIAGVHQQLPIVSAHQQALTNQHLLSHQSLPAIISAAHQGSNILQQQQQHLVAVTAHQNISSVPQQQLPVVTAHRQITNSGSQQVTVAHQSNLSAVSTAAHQQGLVLATHDQVLPLVSVYKPATNLAATGNNSQVVYEGGQTFVVDLSSPALAPQQVSLVNQTVTATPYAEP